MKTRLMYAALLLAACGSKQQTTGNGADCRAEIEKTETAFKVLAAKSGVAEAFYRYADSGAAIVRGNDSLIKGPDAIKQYYNRLSYATATVDWKPDRIEVATSCDLAWSHGRYLWVFTDSSGKKTEYRGNYHTIWKKQRDGGWKFVWD